MNQHHAVTQARQVVPIEAFRVDEVEIPFTLFVELGDVFEHVVPNVTRGVLDVIVDVPDRVAVGVGGAIELVHHGFNPLSLSYV